MAGQLPRPWFRLGSITRPASAPTAPVPEPRPAMVRPPVIRPSALSEPSEHTNSLQSAAVDAKSPPVPPSSVAAFPRPTTSVPSSPAAAKASLPASPAKKVDSPPATMVQKPVLPSPSTDTKQRPGSVHSIPQHKAASPPATTPPTKLSPFSASDPKQSSSLPPSPVNRDTPNNAHSPIPSPTAANSKPNSPSPYQSPKPKSTATPPSPLTLPPSQLHSVGEPKHNNIPQEVERKTVVVQKMVEKPEESDRFGSFQSHNHGNWKINGKKQEVHKDGDQSKEKSIRGKKISGSEQEMNTRVITIAGENRGASMEVIFSDKNKSHQLDRNSTDTENEEGKVNNPKDKSKKSNGIRNSLPMKAFFNSNVQGINNSIMLDSSFTHHDPGIHLVLSRNPSSVNDRDDGQESQKREQE